MKIPDFIEICEALIPWLQPFDSSPGSTKAQIVDIVAKDLKNLSSIITLKLRETYRKFWTQKTRRGLKDLDKINGIN